MSDRDYDRYDSDAGGRETFDAREDSRRGPLLLAAAFAVFVLFVAVVWSAYNQGLREGGRDAPPRIAAGTEPWRERPADPGGVEVPDQDLEVYGRLTGETADGEAAPRPGPEEPIEEAARPRIRVETIDADQAGRPAEPEPQPAETRPATGPADLQTPREPAPQPERRPAVEPEPEPQPARMAAAVRDGAWVVQIASFPDREDAEAAWLAFRTRHSDIATGLSPDMTQADLGARGVYHRLRVAAFASRDDAAEFCETLQSRGQDCLVARR
ncbi:MAG: SPOR domain-containing protein [Maricaulaceae bacterium]|nr:SPOR domain-containing protein [Maricaulaceae bacterium]